jgi:DNA-damage-inducible protein J
MCNTIPTTVKTAVVHARIEPKTKAEAEGVLRRLGLTPAEAIRLFYTQICRRKGVPFAVAVPNEITKQTLEKSQRGEDVEEFESLEGMFASWER